MLRGKWVMEVLLGSPPPPPPPNVPLLDETGGAEGGKMLSTRERMEQHRANPACTSCHRVIDPLGLALENFDVTGVWRIRTTASPVDPVGELYDGTKMNGPAGLRAALLKHQDVFMLSFTESLMTYALGRRVESYDMPAVRAIVRDAGNRTTASRRSSSGVVNSAAFQMSRVEPAERPTRSRDQAPVGRSRTKETKAMIHHQEAPLSPHGAARPGRHDGAAVPRGDGAGAHGVGARPRPRKVRLAAIEMVHGSAGATAFGLQKNLWSPAAVGTRVRPVADAAWRRSSRSATT